MLALSRDLNRIVLEFAPRHVARSHAPATFAELMAAGPGIVWEGASDATIYADPRVNHAFRAWHDAEHIAGQHDLTTGGERATCERQCAAVLARYPRALPIVRAIRAEVIGQVEYFAAFGAFPVDQAAFAAAYLRG